MPDFRKIVATSEAAGLQYYDVQPFAFSTGGQFLARVGAGSPWYKHYTNSTYVPKNVPLRAPTSIILTDSLINVDVSDVAGFYHTENTNATITVGSSGGFPIFYTYGVSISSDAANIIVTLDVGNGSAVNDVIPPTITVSGFIFFYLAPF